MIEIYNVYGVLSIYTIFRSILAAYSTIIFCMGSGVVAIGCMDIRTCDLILQDVMCECLSTFRRKVVLTLHTYLILQDFYEENYLKRFILE